MKKMLRVGFLIPLFALSLVLGGCGSDGKDGRAGTDGNDGLDGSAGVPGAPGEGLATTMSEAHAVTQLLAAEITRVDVADGVMSVNFKVDGLPNPNEVQAEFTIAKWSANDNSWVSMLQRNRTRTTDGVIQGAPVVRASNLRESLLEGNAGAFTYTFTHGEGDIDFSQGAYWTHSEPTGEGAYGEYVQEIVEAVKAAAAWDEEATYRIGVTSRQDERFTAVAYVDGTGAAVTDIPQQVSAETLMSCLDCHGEANIEGHTQFTSHSNRRQDPQLCTTCHNNFTYEAYSSTQEVDGWQMVDMMTMTHTIHAGIPDVYVTSEWEKVRFPDWTFGRTSRPSDETPYPTNPGMANCTACHKGESTAWNVTVSSDPGGVGVAETACVSCHTGNKYAFDLVADHFAGLSYSCDTCHGQTADQIHGVSAARAALELARSYEMEIVSVENAVAGQQAIVTWRVAKDGVYQNLFTGADTYLGAARLGIGWGYGDDWTNDGSGVSSNGDAGRPFQTTANADNTDPGTDNTYAVTTFAALPAEATADRNGFVVVERGPADINVSSVLKTFTLATGAATLGDRRDIVNTESCLTCHNTIGRHRTTADVASGVTSCVTCHNAGSLSRDGSAVQGTVDFMYIMHAIHGVGEKREQFDRRRDHIVEDVNDGGYKYVTYPNTILDCKACHLEGTSDDPVDPEKRLGVLPDLTPNTTGFNSPMATVCFSCHQNGNDELHDAVLKVHFTETGGEMFGNADVEAYLEVSRAETCMLCHKPQ